MFYSLAFQVVVTAAEAALITALVSFVVMQTIKEIASLFGVDLSNQAAAITALVVSLIIALVNGLLIQIPANFVPFAEEIQRLLDLLLAALGPFGLFRVYKGIKTGK